MLKTTERLNMVITLNKHNLFLALVQDCAPDELMRFCDDLDKRKTPHSQYEGEIAIQEELLNDERFFFYLEKVLEIEGLTPRKINEFLCVIREHGKSVMDYPIEQFISSASAVANTNDSAEIFYDFLSCFSCQPLTEAQSIVIITNLRLYRKSLSMPITALPANELGLFKEYVLNERELLPGSDDIDRVFTLLAGQDSPLSIIRFMHKNRVRERLSLDNCEALCRNPTEILKELETLNDQLEENYISLLMRQWLTNHCPMYDLKVLNSRLDTLDKDAVKEALSTRSGYINFIYGGRIKGIPLSEIPRYKEDVLIYAITNKKTGFIRLIEENYDTFAKLDAESILFQREFYAKYININSLNAKNLCDCEWMVGSSIHFESLDADRVYTFEELKVLYGLPKPYYKLYAVLDIPRVDNRIIAFRQISKNRLLNVITDDEHIGKFAEMLSIKPLSAWRDNDFAHIVGLQAQDAVNLLIHRDNIQHLIADMGTRTDSLLVARNPSNAREYSSMDDLKDNLFKADAAWANLVNIMGFSDEFLQANRECIIDFLCKDGGDIAHTYYNGLDSDKHRKSFQLVVKAELMGEFNKLKYYADDLRKELDYPVTNAQKSIWMESTNMFNADGMVIKECDDFYSTMLIGTVPSSTCLAYRAGKYKECLLSNFDSNKKVLYAYKDGMVVSRASIRLTKGRFNTPVATQEASLSFVDVEAADEPMDTPNKVSNNEHLIIFLEYPYSAGIPDATTRRIEDGYVELMSKKADAMGAMLVVSNAYNPTTKDNFVRTNFHVYISKSKAGSQYLDSLNGSAKVSDEGGYRTNSFFISKKDVQQ